jgi:hypothetical protein
MELLESLLALSSVSGCRSLQRPHLYAAVRRMIIHLNDVLRIGDTVTVNEREYTLCRLAQAQIGEGEPKWVYLITVNNGRGPAILGEKIHVKPFLPHASYEEHVIFAERSKDIIDAFGKLLKTEVVRSEAAEQEAISESQYVERII